MPPPYCYEYPRPSVTVDLVALALSGDELHVLLIRRKQDPFAGFWALPGGFLNIEESMEEGARRELREETGFSPVGPVEFIGVYGEPNRDPRGRTFSLAHATVIRGPEVDVKGGDDASEAAWRIARGDSPLAFDHPLILAKALDWLAQGVKAGPLGLAILPEEFDETEVRAMHRAIFGSQASALQWLRKMDQRDLIEPSIGSGNRYRGRQTKLRR